MLTDMMLPEAVRALRDEVRAFAASVPRQLLLDMDADRVRFPREFLQEAGRRNLLGLRFDPAWGGRGLPWTAEMVAL
jgi:alkylation response protein AidB-like acyl-CoA dehydrogenase